LRAAGQLRIAVECHRHGSFQAGVGVGTNAVNPLVKTHSSTYLDVGVNVDITPHVHRIMK